MNRLKESKTLMSMSRYLLAAGYALVGRPDVSKELVVKTTALTTACSGYDQTFGSDLRDTSIRLMTFCLLGDGTVSYTHLTLPGGSFRLYGEI